MPSKLIAEGSSIDINIAHIGQEYENLISENARRKEKGLPPLAPKLTEAEMTAMINRVERQNDNNKDSKR